MADSEEGPYDPSMNDNTVPTLPNVAHPEQSQQWVWQLLRSKFFRVFTGLAVLFILLWTFCITAAVHPIYITNGISQEVVWSAPKTVNYIATPIATVFAIITTYYFNQCVRLAMRKHLTQTLEARAFLRWNAIANKHILRERLRWTAFTLLSAVLLAALTTGFTATFTPQQLRLIKTQNTFRELDLSSNAFLDIYTPMSSDLPCHYDNYTFFSCSKSGQRRPLMILEAGESSALTGLGYFASTNFVQIAFYNTSGGVMPFGGSSDAIWFAGNSSRPTYSYPGLYLDFMSYNASYLQQGLTANVACTLENSSPLDYTVAQSFPNGNSNLSIITPTIVCDNASAAPLAQQVVGTDFLLAASCSLANKTQYIHLRGYGAYKVNPADGTTLIANMTCQLDPIFTTNIATFVGDFDNVIVYPIPNASVPAVPNSNTTLINDITAALPLSLLDGQSANGNAFADFVQGLIDAYPGQVTPNTTVESMLQGMFEISGLSVNGYWSSKLLASGSPEGPFSRSVSGNLTYDLYGWNGDVRGVAGLIPFTVIATIGLLLLVWSYDGGSRLHYDPSDPVSLVVASAAGDFGWVTDVDIETDNMKSLSTGFAYQKVDGRWALTGLPQPFIGKEE